MAINAKFLRAFLLFSIMIILGQSNAFGQRHLYSYPGIDRPWDGISTWVSEPDGLPNPALPIYPQSGDFLHIQGDPNLVVYLRSNVDLSNLTILIEDGALDLRTYSFVQPITQLGGTGRLMIGHSYFPSVGTNNLTATGGGTVEFYSFSGTLPTTQSIYHNLTLSGSGGQSMAIASNLTLSGNLSIRLNGSGNFSGIIGNNETSRTLTVNGSINVFSGATLGVGSSNAVHNIFSFGDINNDGGSIILNNSATPYTLSVNGAANITFTGTANQEFSGSGTNKLYRMIVNKGISQTPILTVNPELFSLTYPTSGLATDKALQLINGTLSLGDKISIPKLTDQDLSVSQSDFVIPATTHLRIDGASVNVTDNDGSFTNTALSILGKVTITDGLLNTEKSTGILLNGGQLIVQGGTVNTAQIQGAGAATLSTTGGELNIGNIDGSNPNPSYPSIYLPSTSYTFTMSGGEINIYPTAAGALEIGAYDYTITGGFVNVYTGGSTVKFNSTAPMYNLSIFGSGGTLTLLPILASETYPLVVNHNLTIGTGTTLRTNNTNVKIARNLTIASGATYNHGNNTTEFFYYGINSATVTNNGTITPLTLSNVLINKADGVNTFNNAKTIAFPASGMNIMGSLTLDAAYQTVNLNNVQLQIQGNLTVNYVSRLLNDLNILLKPNTPIQQSVTIGKLTNTSSYILDNTSGAKLTESASMTNLTLTNGSFFIGNKRLTLNNPVIGTGFGENKMVSTDGQTGELRYIYNGTTSPRTVLYPVGKGSYLPDGETLYTYLESFNSGIPAGWSQDRLEGTVNRWSVAGGQAIFNSSSTLDQTRLVTSEFDFRDKSVTLTIDLDIPSGGGETDALHIQYFDGSWKTIETISVFLARNTINIKLPSGALIQNCRLGLLGVGSNKNGTAINIYEISITNQSPDIKYTPFTLNISGAGSFTASVNNYLGVIPVNSPHPLANPAFKFSDQIIQYYWKTTRSGSFTGSLTFEYRFDFYYNDRIKSGGSYRTWRYVNNNWIQGGTYDETFSATDPRGRISFLAAQAVGFIQGDFTAGNQNAFAAGTTANTFYSRQSGNWITRATWSTDPVNQHNGVATTLDITANDHVIISPLHTVTIANASREAKFLLLGGTLDITGGLTGHVFTELRGDGTLRLSTVTLPTVTNTYTNFTTTDNSTIEFYGLPASSEIPSLFNTYYNLHISTSTGVRLPNNLNLNIRNNLIFNGATASLSNNTNGNLNITNELGIYNSGVLTIPITTEENARTINANNVVVNNAIFETEAGAGALHLLNINGGGISALAGGQINLYQTNNFVNVTLSGAGNSSLGADGNIISLNRLIVNKPNLFDTLSVTGRLVLNAPTNIASKALALNGGTFILESTTGTPTDITLTSGDSDFTIPSTAALVVRGTANKVRTTNGFSLILDGLFRLDGSGEGLFDGSIKYSNSGNASLNINGSSKLILGRQLMRNEAAGSIKYLQTGGAVEVGTLGITSVSNGIFEILGDESSFIYSGGTLKVARGTGYEYGDIYLEPEIFEVGSNAVLNIEAAVPEQTITINTRSPLSTLNIAAANNPIVQPKVRRLVLMGDFINAATYQSNGRSLVVKGNFTNSGTFTSSTSDTLIFSGSVQTLSNTGAATFTNFVSEPSASLTVNNNIIITGNLAINSGSLLDAGRTIEVNGNLRNTATHDGTGRISLRGSSLRHDISGNGVYGNLEIDNPLGARLMNNISLERDLILTQGIFNIQNQLLSLRVNSNIQGAPFSATKMIQTNGSNGGEALEKNFSPSFNQPSFLFPIGTPLKYRPMTMYFTYPVEHPFGGGTLKVYPVNGPHPTINNPADIPRVLQYYWGVVSLLEGYSGYLRFDFKNEDLGSSSNINLYYAAQLVFKNDVWLKNELSADEIAGRYVTFTFGNAKSEQIDGSFTAGEESAIPNVVTTFSTVASGDWDVPEIWDRGIVPPQGVIVVINAGHTVTITTNGKRPYRTRISGRLEIKRGTEMHNFGLVQGDGVLALEDGKLPFGKWRQALNEPPGFLPTEGFCGTGIGTVEFGGNYSYEIDSDINTYYNLIITGSGVKNTSNLANKNITICNDLIVNGSATFGIRSQNITTARRQITIGGDLFIGTGATFGPESFAFRYVDYYIYGNIIKEEEGFFKDNILGTHTYLVGEQPQNISENFIGTNRAFQVLIMNNPNGFLMNYNLSTLEALFTNGVFNNKGFTFNITSPTGAIGIRDNRVGSYLTGRLNRLVITLSSSQENGNVFPVGGIVKKNTWLLSASNAGPWAVEYRQNNPNDQGFSPSNRESGLNAVSSTEYWVINGPNTRTAKIRLTLNGTSEIATAIGWANRDRLRIVRWNSATTQWEIVGTNVTFTGSVITNATITTSDNVTFNGSDQYFTIGSIDPVNIVTAQFTTGNQTICYNGNASLNVRFSGTPNYNLTYTVNSTPTTVTGITTTDYPINLTNLTSNTTVAITAVSNTGGATGIILNGTVVVTVIPQPTLFTVGGGGPVCGISEASVSLSGSQAGYTYNLYRGAGEFVMSLSGTGFPLIFTPIYVAGIYYVEAFRAVPLECPRRMTGDTEIIILPKSTVELTGLSSTVGCEGDYISLNFNILAAPPFTITVLENGSGRTLTIEDTDLVPGVGANNFIYNFIAEWTNQGLSTPGLAVYSYSITSFYDTSGCDSVVSTTANSIDVWKRPITGPQYHIPNTFGE